ncbi:M56 family metallopeptidase [Mycobacteroides abscessus]|uniref:M56 family metallopeptidase n=1 Tax=Mycobacteroides abscessus TaxID=36809 RepID=UPI0019D0F010|nr:M56 family metallopeptidase [Mycobacteroides abscessus]QSM61160.1 M56 family metallopeptidase [Mycobacteroides abscessus subsp. abscessus]
MIYTVYLPLLAVLILAGMAPVLGQWLSPSVATRVLGAVALLTGTATVTTLLLLGIGGVLRPMALVGWGLDPDTARALLAADSVPWPLGAAATMMLAVAVVRAWRVIRGERAALNDLRRVVAGHDGELLVLDDERPYAYAVPSGLGTIIVSTAMLSTLDAAERRAMLAHERAHLSGHHHRYRMVSRLAAAVNPALRQLDRQIGFQIERCADEHAATATGRPVAARSLARAALAGPAGSSGVLAYAEHAVASRVRALSTGPTPDRWIAVLPSLVLAAMAMAALADAAGACCRLLAML